MMIAFQNTAVKIVIKYSWNGFLRTLNLYVGNSFQKRSKDAEINIAKSNNCHVCESSLNGESMLDFG